MLKEEEQVKISREPPLGSEETNPQVAEAINNKFAAVDDNAEAAALKHHPSPTSVQPSRLLLNPCTSSSTTSAFPIHPLWHLPRQNNRIHGETMSPLVHISSC